MINLITNEQKLIKDIMEQNDISLAKGRSIGFIIKLLAKYYINNDIENKIDLDSDKIIDSIMNRMNEFNIDVNRYQPSDYYNYTKNMVNNIIKNKDYKFRIMENIPLYKSEYDTIMSCNSKVEKKILFTMYIIARYMECNGIVIL